MFSRNDKNFLYASVVALLSVTTTAPVNSAECFDKAVNRYNQAKATLKAPRDKAVLSLNGKSYPCQVQKIHLHDYEAVVLCSNKMRFHIGEQARCDLTQSGPQCDGVLIGVKGPGVQEKMVLSPATKTTRKCLSIGAQLELSNSFNLKGLGKGTITTYHIFAP